MNAAALSSLSFDYIGQTVIVTGAARGIGLEIGRFFAAAGATTYLVDFDEAAAESAAQAVGARHARVDVAITADVDAAVAKAAEETGRIDVLINNAGILRDRMLWKLSDDDWERVLAVHAGGTFRFLRACVPHFRSRGYGGVVNITSYTGLRGNIGQANYATAKAGIIGFTKTAAKELAGFGITVNAISPNAATRMIASIPEERRAELAAEIPLGRFAEPAEMAPAVGFLASPEAGYITGAVLPVDGGLSMSAPKTSATASRDRSAS